MSPRVRELLDRISALEYELSSELHRRDRRLQFRSVGSSPAFSDVTLQSHRKQRMGLWRWLSGVPATSFLALPFIYGMAVALVFLDVSISLYQAVCFPLYGIAKVRRHDYMAIDRHRLEYLNAFEKVHCAYCSYANGLLAYAREIGARTEQYFCPIKHSRQVPGTHARYARFLDFGDAIDFHARAERLRRELAAERTRARSAGNQNNGL
jgi:hypothetical protein